MYWSGRIGLPLYFILAMHAYVYVHYMEIFGLECLFLHCSVVEKKSKSQVLDVDLASSPLGPRLAVWGLNLVSGCFRWRCWNSESDRYKAGSKH